MYTVSSALSVRIGLGGIRWEEQLPTLKTCPIVQQVHKNNRKACKKMPRFIAHGSLWLIKSVCWELGWIFPTSRTKHVWFIIIRGLFVPAQQKNNGHNVVLHVVLVLVNSGAWKVCGIDINSNVSIRTMQERTLDYSRSLHILNGIAEFCPFRNTYFFNSTFLDCGCPWIGLSKMFQKQLRCHNFCMYVWTKS